MIAKRNYERSGLLIILKQTNPIKSPFFFLSRDRPYCWDSGVNNCGAFKNTEDRQKDLSFVFKAWQHSNSSRPFSSDTYLLIGWMSITWPTVGGRTAREITLTLKPAAVFTFQMPPIFLFRALSVLCTKWNITKERPAGFCPSFSILFTRLSQSKQLRKQLHIHLIDQ